MNASPTTRSPRPLRLTAGLMLVVALVVGLFSGRLALLADPFVVVVLLLGAGAGLVAWRGSHARLASDAAEQRDKVRAQGELVQSAVEALAQAIDAKDQPSPGHIRRVRVYAEGLGRSLGMSQAEIDALRTAAILHDVGKLAVPDHILSKSGSLTHEEFQKIRIHPQVGAEIIRDVPFGGDVASIVMDHHERWDGRGYPTGLKGEDIPLGARIMAVVDYYDAVTSERPYHKAMTPEAAMVLLKQEAGRAFDPLVVGRFLELLPRLREEAAEAVQAMPDRLRIPMAAYDPVSDRMRAEAPNDVFENIALAHREIYALYEIAHTMGTSLGVSDTMRVISSKLINLVPFSACALFLHDEPSEMLRCRFATGIDADLVQQVKVRAGHGMTGWVARNRRALVNARPGADLDISDVVGRPSVLQSALVCPLVSNDRLVGTLGVYDTQAGRYSEDHRRLLERVCEQAAAVICNSILFEQTQEDSLTDALTALPNTRFLFMHLGRELARAERLKAELSLLVLDLDNFKEINDYYGHRVGDRALQEIARALRNGIRPYDVCVRYAGDEFIVVLSGCAAEEAENKRADLQSAVERIVFESRPGHRVPLSLSAGAAVFPHDGDTYETLLAAADGRMYRDKTKRKRAGIGRFALDRSVSPLADELGLSEFDLQRAAMGVL